ncbi:MAG: preprotein translocase subunit YajC [Planctomycetota bacterium]
MTIAFQDAQPSVPGMPAEAQAQPTIPGDPAATGDPAAAPAGPPPGGLGGLGLFIPLIGVMILMIFLSGSAQRKEKKRKAELLSSIKKHDKVQTIGGLIATISEVRDDEVVLIIDDQTKTKAIYSKASVQQVLRQAPGSTEVEEMPADPQLATQPS